VSAGMGATDQKAEKANLASSRLQFIGSSRGVLLLLTKDAGDRVRLVALDCETGEVLWLKPRLHLIESLSVLALQSSVLVFTAPESTNAPSARTGSLLAFDIRDGRELWRIGGLATQNLRMLDLHDRHILLLRTRYTDPPILQAVDTDSGRELWKITGHGKLDFSLPVENTAAGSRGFGFGAGLAAQAGLANVQDGDDLFLARGLESRLGAASKLEKESGIVMGEVLTKYDLNTGAVRWTYSYQGGSIYGFFSAWALSADFVYVRQYNKIVALNRATGEKVFESAKLNDSMLSYQYYAQLIPAGDLIYFHAPSGAWFFTGRSRPALKAYRRLTGEFAWEVNSIDHTLPGFVTLGDSIVFADDKNILVFNRVTGAEVSRKPHGFRQPPQSLIKISEQEFALLAPMQAAVYEVGSWRELRNTGEIPLPTRSVANKIRNVIGFGVIVTFAPLAGLAAAPILPPDRLRAVRNLSTERFYFVTGREPDLDLLSIDARTGVKATAGPYNGEDLGTVVDEFRGVLFAVHDHRVVASRLAGGESRARVLRYMDPFGTGGTTLQRAERLAASGLDSTAVVECRAASREFESALAAAADLADEVLARINLGRASDCVARLAPDLREEWQEKALGQYRTIVEKTQGVTDSRIDEAIRIARERVRKEPAS